ncbi:MAG TPA: primase-helicase family protein [Steroidobacteraceae bacterium]|nr:primase-helicase family protein [Steroidobacteraceae bacterium]
MTIDLSGGTGPSSPRSRYVKTQAIKAAVAGREAEVVRALGIRWPGRGHIHCPYPDHEDRNPSWRLTEQGLCICTCNDGEAHHVLDAAMRVLGLDFEGAKLRVAELLGRDDLVVDPNGDKGLTLAEYAEAKKLPIEFLAKLGVCHQNRWGKPAVRIPYFRLDGSAPSIKFRVSLSGEKKTRWRKGDHACLYGEWYRDLFREAGFVVVVEGESDAQTLWVHNFPAYGLPGAAAWDEARDAPLCDGIGAIYVIVEPDRGGQATLAWLARSSIVDRARVVRTTPACKDPSALYLSDPEQFVSAFNGWLAAAEPLPACTIESPPPLPRTPLEEVINEFNSKYAVVNETGQAVVYERIYDPVLQRSALCRIRFEDLRKFYQNRPVTLELAGRSVTRSAAEWWLGHADRRQFLRGVVFDPTNKPPANCWNLWSGFSVAPTPGDWSLMRDHIRLVICSGVENHADYVLNWLGRLFQQPNRQGEVALIFRGAKGVGKGILARWIVKAFGQHGIHIFNPIQLVGRFNLHLRDCLILFGDEAFYAGDRQHEGVLKGLITEPLLPIEGKGRDLVIVPNMLHVILASNSDWVIPASADERRYAVFDVPDSRRGDLAYFADIEKQMENGGLAAMIHDLLERDITRFEVRNVPATEALTTQKTLSLASIEKWWLAVLSRGFLWKSRHGAMYFQQWQAFYSTELLHRSYLQWVQENHPYDRKTREDLGRFMTKIYTPCRPADGKKYPVYELDSIDRELLKEGKTLDNISIVFKERPPGYTVGELSEARVRFTEIYPVVTEWGLDP